MNRDSMPTSLFPGFSQSRLGVNGITVNAVYGGDGPPVLLLHGYPQTHVMWHRVAPMLAERCTVVCPDLRGYGDSTKPPSQGSHEPYSKRVMAGDQVELMRALGFERFAVVGHDRGGRVARRLALDQPDAVSRLGLLDIIPTRTIYGTLDQRRPAAGPRAYTIAAGVVGGLVEELLAERGIEVDHVTVDRWVQRFTPLLADAARFARHSPGRTHAAANWAGTRTAADEQPS